MKYLNGSFCNVCHQVLPKDDEHGVLCNHHLDLWMESHEGLKARENVFAGYGDYRLLWIKKQIIDNTINVWSTDT